MSVESFIEHFCSNQEYLQYKDIGESRYIPTGYIRIIMEIF